MASRKENLKALFTNSRTRVIIIFTVILLIVAVMIGVVRFTTITRMVGPEPATEVGTAPAGIQSIPGALDPTAQYASLVQARNVEQAKQARQKGGSAIPTIIRTHAFGEGVAPIGPAPGTTELGYVALSREETDGAQQGLWMQALKAANCSKASMQKVISQGGTITDLKKSCSCAQLKDNGYALSELEKVCSCQDLKAAGFNVRELKDAGFSAGRLRLCGFDACELRNAGFTAQQMKNGGFTDGELKGAGYPDEDIARAGGLPGGITAADVRKAGCDADALVNLREAGVSAAAIRRINGCSAAQLKAAGFTAQDLKNAGFSAADLKNAGFTPEELKNAGFTARDLLNAGFSPAQLSSAGYSPAQIKAAETELPPGITPESIKDAGCSVEAIRKERLAGVSATLIRQYAGCNAAALKAAGFTDNDLANAGFTPAQISAASPVSDNAIRAAGCDPSKLRALFQQGVSAKRIHDLNGCSASALKAAGFDAKALTDAGFTPQQLAAAGFTPEQISNAEAASDAAIRAAGCDPAKLKALFAEGVSAKRIHELNGCNANELKEAGFGAKALADAGFTPEQLIGAGFSPQQLVQSGISHAGAIAAGRTANCSVASLKAARALGVSAETIKQTLGCSAKAMADAGYTAAELKNAGFTAAELKNAGFSAQQLKNAGFSAKELHDAGFSPEQLKQAGFSATQLKDAGVSASQLKNAGFTAEQLKDAGFSAKDLKDAGFSARDLKDAGFNATELANAGFSKQAIQDAGMTPMDATVPGLSAAPIPPSPSSMMTGIPSVDPTAVPARPAGQDAANTKQLQATLNRQQKQMAAQRHQQKIQQRTSQMLAAANQALQEWKTVSTQVFVAGSAIEKGGADAATAIGLSRRDDTGALDAAHAGTAVKKALIKTGDVIFAVLETSVNSDEPGPILATVVSGRFKGATLIGSFNLPSNADRLIISFNTMSVPGAAKSVSISAYAIDPNTARTALSSSTDHHYLLRYGSLFAATFLEGFGNAFQSANTTITIGGTGQATNTTIQSGVGRSALENAVIGLATLGKNWGQVAQQQFSRPTTVEVCSGTGLGILFTQDLTSL